MSLEEQKRRLKAHLILQKGQEFKRVALPNSIEWEYKYYNKIYDPNNNVTVWISKHKVQIFLCRGTDFNLKLQLSARYIRRISGFVAHVYMCWNSHKHLYNLEHFEGLVSKFGELFVQFLLINIGDIQRIVEEPDNDLYPDP